MVAGPPIQPVSQKSAYIKENEEFQGVGNFFYNHDPTNWTMAEVCCAVLWTYSLT